VDDKYLKLGRLIAGQCPAGFREARLEAALDVSWADFKLTCTGPEGGEAERPIAGPAVSEIHIMLADIREAMAAQDGSGLWRNCVVTLRQGGHFAIDVEY
jgi:hypothetical protein